MKVATLIARAMEAKSSRQSRIYNETRSFGESMKVIGWTPEQYERCARILTSLGCRVRIVKTPRNERYNYGGNLRLWVYG